ncbi:MAG: hypothetical protein ACRERV_14145 [Methylococcales bacterium]
MNEEAQAKATAAVMALAHRTESAGKKDGKDAKLSKGAWQPMPHGHNQLMHEGKLREAVAYYEIAESIHREAAGLGYPRAMLLEAMGAYDEAIVVFQALKGTYYEQPGQMGIKRCQDKQKGNYDELAALGLPKEFTDAFAGLDADAFFAELDAGPNDEIINAKHERAQNVLEEKLKQAKTLPPADDETIRQEATDTALAFVNHLLDRNYSAARKMLHPHESGFTEEELRESFEPMFEDEDFPQSANVFDVQTDMLNLELDDIAWVYISIDSENAEAISLHVARDKKRLVVRNIEWGRP